MSGESDVLEAALNVMGTTLEMYSLIAAVDTALAVKAPAGDPDIVVAQADTYGRVAHMCRDVADDAEKVKTQSLPVSWRGQAAENAAGALFMLCDQALTAEEAFTVGSKVLATWADQLRTAQHQDAQGRELLQGARTVLSHLYLQDLVTLGPSLIPPLTREAAISGCHDRWAAANLAADAGDASAALRQWSEQARAQQIRVPGVNALTAVTLAYYGQDGFLANYGLQNSVGYYGFDAPSGLTPATFMLASEHLDAMSPTDRAAFETLVAHASSVTEAEYLWKAASVGKVGQPNHPAYSLGQLESFVAVIHPHGNDPAWLQQQLNPGIDATPPAPGTVGTKIPVTFEGSLIATFSQGKDPDCVAASTVMARLAADPVLMLGVTTGQGPAAVGGAKVGDDSAKAVAARAQTLFNQYYDYGRAVEGDDVKKILYANKFDIIYQPPAGPGIGVSTGAIALDGQLLTPVTGSAYQYQPLNDTADRQAALPKIEAAAEAGKPVPIEVSSSSAAHQMVIEDYQSGELEIYNPWGVMQWVPTQQFVDGQLGDLTGSSPSKGLPHPFGVALPEQ